MAEANKSVVQPEAMDAADAMTTIESTPAEMPAAEEKTETKKKPGRKPGRKPGAKKPGRKPAAEKKEAETKTAETKTTTRRTAVKEAVHVQFSGKTYSTEDLVNIAKNVWKYDLNKKVGDFKKVELYVKPEESVVYYVINDEEKGQFNI